MGEWNFLFAKLDVINYIGLYSPCFDRRIELILRFDGHLLFVGDTDVLPEAVLVLEILIAQIALAGRLGGVLGANMSPKIDRRYDHFAKLTFSPLIVGRI